MTSANPSHGLCRRVGGREGVGERGRRTLANYTTAVSHPTASRRG